jgi:hypothetical protein
VLLLCCSHHQKWTRVGSQSQRPSTMAIDFLWVWLVREGERRDLNPRPLEPHSSCLGSHPGLPSIVGNPIPLQEYICRSGLYPYHFHCGCMALTIATIPAFTAVGRCSHADTTVARSSGTSCTHSAHFSCKNMSFGCVECVLAGEDARVGESPKDSAQEIRGGFHTAQSLALL